MKFNFIRRISRKTLDYKNCKKIKVIQFEERNLNAFINHAFRNLLIVYIVELGFIIETADTGSSIKSK